MFEEDRKRDWSYAFLVGGIIASIAFVALFVRMPAAIGHGRLAEFLYMILIAVFAYAGAHAGVWIYERTVARRERERTSNLIKAAQNRERNARKAAEFAESARQSKQAEEFQDLKTRCRNYEVEVRALRAELARQAPADAARTPTLLCH